MRDTTGAGSGCPSWPPQKTLAAISGDNTAQIQAALDAVSRLPLNASGFRGAVLLQAGTFEVAGTLHISASGVVLRGSGSGGGTHIQLSSPPHRFLEIRGNGPPQAADNTAGIKDAYVASGAAVVHVQNGDFHAGDTVLVIHPVTEAWVHFMGMDTLVRDGKAQTWIKAGSAIRTDRVVQRVLGDAVTLDVPLTDNLDARFLQPGGARLVRSMFPGRISEVGVHPAWMCLSLTGSTPCFGWMPSWTHGHGTSWCRRRRTVS